MQDIISSKTNLFDVFISHNRESSLPFVEKLANWFEKENGIKCWYAPRNLDNTGAGKDYDDEIVYAIEHSRCVVVVLNDAALQAKWVKHEVNYAEKQNKRIIPFAISELSISNGLRMRLDDLHIVTAYPHPEEKFPLLLKNVQQLLGRVVTSVEIQKPLAKIDQSNEFDFDYDNGIALLDSGDDKAAFLAFLCSAQNGNKAAADKLIEIARRNCKNSRFLDDNIWEDVNKIADEGEGYAELLMHFKYYSMGTEKEKAIEYLKNAMRKYDSSEAYLQLGICYGWGIGVPQSDVLAKRYYEIALAKGNGLACRYLGQLYLYGGNDIEKNSIAAEEYFKKGVEMGIDSCFSLLFEKYAKEGTYEKAQEIASKMVDRQIKGGYTVMGDYFYYCEQNLKQAEVWYNEAAKREENKAWGKLAVLFLLSEKAEEAERYALKGYLKNDSISFKVLARLSEDRKDFMKAWDYYSQSINKFGTGYEGLAKLYLVYNYHPNNYNLTDLKRDLELSVRLQDVESVKYLLKLLLIENGKGEEKITYDTLKNIPDAYEVLRMGANSGDCDSLFIYGRLLLEGEGDIFNPFRGIDFVESAAEKGQRDAIIYAFDYFKNESPQKMYAMSEKIVNGKLYAGKETKRVIECFLHKNMPSVVYVDWLYRSLRILVWEDVVLFFDCFKSFKDAIEILKENVKDWIDEQVDSFLEEYHSDTTIGIIYVPFYAYLLGRKLSLEPFPKESSIIQNIREIVDIENDISFITKIPYFKKFVQEIWPDYSNEKILAGDFSNERDFRIFSGVIDNSFPDLLEINENDPEGSIREINNYLSEAIFPKGCNSTKIKLFFSAYTGLLDSYENLKIRACAQSIDETLNIQSPCVCYSIDETLYYGLKSLKMLIASRFAYGKRWQEVVANLDNVKQLSEIAKSFADQDVRNLLCRYCEFIDARNELLKFDIQLEHGTCSYIVDTINAVIDEMSENNVLHDIPRATEEDISDSTKDLKSSMFDFSATLKDYLFISNKYVQ
ncbi:MAG: toll/interleukin-1 receptor domain-containing protein [Bacteroidaceae bacterium]|nr:toll/interleukin-1 receptor domain-containing protein [Bacteroidaceae bacterium]